MEGTHHIAINVPDHLNKCILRIEDFSVYNPILPFSAPSVLVQPPGFPCVEFNLLNANVEQNFVLNLNACNLELQDSNCGFVQNNLPDGIYTVEFSVAPNDILYHKVYHLRTTILSNLLLDKYLELSLLNDDPTLETRSKLNNLTLIENYLNAGKAYAKNGDCKNAIKMYEYAKKLMSKLTCVNC